MHDLVPLSQVPSGSMALVTELIGGPEQVHRLEELGLRRGATIEMVRAGSPCILRVSGSKLCFRDGQLLNVLVRRGAVT